MGKKKVPRSAFKTGNQAAKGRGPRQGGRPTDASVLYVSTKLQSAQCELGKEVLNGRDAFVRQLTRGMCATNAKGEPTAKSVYFLKLFAQYAFAEVKAPTSGPGNTRQEERKEDIKPMVDSAIDALLKDQGEKLGALDPVGQPEEIGPGTGGAA